MIEELRKEREIQGVSLSQIARESGLDIRQVRRFFNKKGYDPRISTLKKITKALKKEWKLFA